MRFLPLIIAAFLASNFISAQTQKSDPWFGESCTSIMVGKKASADGSVITSHTCDGNYRTWLRMEPAKDHNDTTFHEVFKGTLHTETPWDMRNVKLAGKIPQVKHTYAYLNTAYPSLNEKQLAIGETTFVGPDTLVNKNGMFLIEELQRIALQRCDNARGAVKLIGELIKEYGYGDWGECITIADKYEVWQMEILGEGPARIGGVWAAQRIPDDHVGISANISRIGVIDRNNPDFFMASDNIEAVAKEFGLWDGEGIFKFWKAYGDQEKPFKIREFFVLSSLAPALKLTMDMDELPFSVKPEQKITMEKMMGLYRATYEGTEFDMTQNVKYIKKKYDDNRKEIGQDTIISPVANPWLTTDMRNTLNFLSEGTIEFQRTVSVSWCSYSFITQLRDWLPDAVGGISWFSFDNPGESPRIPIFAGVNSLPESFELCGQKGYREDAAIWNYRRANKLATVSWGKTKHVMLENVKEFEHKAFDEMPLIENKAIMLLKEGKDEETSKYLSQYTSNFSGTTVQRWKELEHRFWGMFGRGF
ncbi:MAG: peptidase [Bacteroidetes bacterium HGW-Bacteroidetes-1]|nr:MAG: peptidase [Bacteroidetes bacterium HGW-Bacteroidetes-1]